MAALFTTCPAYHPLLLGGSTDRYGVCFTCDACGVRNVEVAVSCRPCAYDVCRVCYFGTQLLKEDVALAERRVMEAVAELNALREKQMDQECWV